MRKAVCCLLILVYFAAQAQERIWFSGGKLKPEQAIMDIRHYTLNLSVDPVQKSISGFTEIDLILSESSPVLLFDLINHYKISTVTVNGKKASFRHENDLISVNPAMALAAGKQKIRIDYSGQPPVAKRAPWDGGFQWAKDSLGNDWIAITCQTEGGDLYFPCKDHPSDEPNEGADLIITVPKGLTVAGPGLLKKTSSSGKTSTFHWKTNYTINNYSILFNIGKYKAVTKPYTTINGNKVPMTFYVLESHADKAPHHLEIFERTVKVMEKYFGEFPWVKEKIGMAETPHLGMEHQTLNAYGNGFRYTKVGGEDCDWLLTHEFGHEWWANKVTDKNYEDMWIQEGICSFGDALYVRELEGEEAYLKRMKNTARNTQNKQAVVPKPDATSKEVYQGDIYGKGAFFMHTIRYITGDEVFFPALKKLATDSAYTYDNRTTTDDVEKLFSKESGIDLKPVFDFYLRTINKLEVSLTQTKEDSYLVQLLNYEGVLPMDIQTDAGIARMNIDKKGITVTSKTQPVVDPKTYYLKKVILE
jgi:aminopeptidase N